MNIKNPIYAYKAQLSISEFQQISKFIGLNYGIKLPQQKRIMVQGRLHKRLRALDMGSFKDYVNYLFSEEGKWKEVPNMVDLISTNKTDFFREATHFNVLTEQVLPEFIKNNTMSTFNIWSAGCSSGEEVYTLAMVIQEFMNNHQGYHYHVQGTDISHQMIKKARTAIYPLKDVATIPLHLKRKYLLKHKDRSIKEIRIAPDLRNKTSFKYLNFIDKEYDIKTKFNVAFCRNVLIYFEKDVQEQVLLKILKTVKKGGYLFLGHSESINEMKLPVTKISPTVFKKI
ncbi:MAG: chemotaxis protein CheR [Bacteroidetes bacterium 4572_77]|nr:MAG: chemotaxis protein CheR [Bacteroidetes bacterium 4572_77]